MHLQRNIGLLGLTFIAVSGVIGSGWLFAPLLAAKMAGGAAVLAWLIAAVLMLVIALTFAEVAAIIPAAGGIAAIPYASHGTVTSMLIGWSAWIGYLCMAPIETQVTLKYLYLLFPRLYDPDSADSLSLIGHVVAAGLLAIFVVINIFGVRLFTRINETITWFKIVVPVAFSAIILTTAFEPANFTSHGGFMPYGIEGVMMAISSGGVVFALIGFRHAIDLAGEVKDPQRTIPLALGLSIVICGLIFIAVQVAFIGAVPAASLANGWSGLTFKHDLGPIGAIAAATGMLWLLTVINASAVVSPFGGGLVTTGSNARLVMALANNGLLPTVLHRVSVAGVPFNALLLNFLLGTAVLFLLPFTEIMELCVSAVVFSLVAGPIAVVALRREAPGLPRHFRLPAVLPLATLGFAAASAIILWTGWDSIFRLGITLVIGVGVIAVRLRIAPPEKRDIGAAIWLLPYILLIGVLAWLGKAGGGAGILPFAWQLLAVAVLSLGCFVLAIRSRLAGDRFQAALTEVQQEIEEESGDGGAPNAHA